MEDLYTSIAAAAAVLFGDEDTIKLNPHDPLFDAVGNDFMLEGGKVISRDTFIEVGIENPALVSETLDIFVRDSKQTEELWKTTAALVERFRRGHALASQIKRLTPAEEKEAA